MASHALRRTRSPRTAVALVASTGLALTAVAAGAAAADTVPADASAGSLHGSGTAALASGAREVITTNKAVTVNADAAASEDVTTASAVERTEDTVAVQKAAAEKKAAEEAAAARAAEEAAATEQASAAATTPDTTTQDAAATTSSSGASTASTTTSGSSLGAAIAATALQYQGVPYVSGGSTPSGWDCSGFVQWVYAQHGISLPRTSYAQGAAGTTVSAAQAQPGDIVYYGYHVGIYVGNGMMADAGNTAVDTVYRAVWGSPTYVHIG
ncbi:C40 family peptidase [Actinomyces radicidentis]|uniref:C40 family peptidase n=1 Tax=Actinomyces radicidentis TaxID=111015 RepID=UPI0028E74DFB|nr:C40 family peptidase [Actinomyces radicidentis]